MPFPSVIPHSDGAGMIDAVGDGVDPTRVGQPAWCYGAQSYRPFGTAAEYSVVPERLAVPLPADADAAVLEQAACLGIAGITAYRAVFADGPVDGLHVLIYGAARGVGNIAAQMAIRDGAHVIAVVRDEQQGHDLEAIGIDHTFLAETPDLTSQIRGVAPEGVHRIADVDFGNHIELNAQIVANGATISAYYSSDPQPAIPYWTLGFADTTLRLLGSDDFSPEVKADAARTLTEALAQGALHVPISNRFALEDVALAHELVERGGVPGRVVLTIDERWATDQGLL
jgi:NADPH2:quinone reductase